MTIHARRSSVFTPGLLLLMCLTACDSWDPQAGVSRERTEAYWKQLHESMAPLEPGFREATEAKKAANRLRELTGAAWTASRPDPRLASLISQIGQALDDYSDLIEGHQKLSKLALANKANQEELHAFTSAVILMGRADRRFQALQDKLEKHRLVMEAKYGCSLPAIKRIRQEYLVEAR